GALNQACCSVGMDCQATGTDCGVSPTGRKCITCGGMGQPCCGFGDEGDCNDGLGCGGRNADMGVTGMCATCGAMGQPCCSNGPECQTGLTCGPPNSPSPTCIAGAGARTR